MTQFSGQPDGGCDPDGSAPDVLPDETYGYDRVGNRTFTHLSSTYMYDSANRLVEDDRFTYLYDSVGNLIRRTRTPTGSQTRIGTVWSALWIQHDWEEKYNLMTPATCKLCEK